MISLRNIRGALPPKADHLDGPRRLLRSPAGDFHRSVGASPEDVFTGLNRIGRREFSLDKDITILAGMRREAALYGMDSLRRRRHSLFRAVML